MTTNIQIKQILYVACIVATTISANASAMSINVGYQNPPVSTWGVNLLWIGAKYGFEVGVGKIVAAANDDDDNERNDRAALHLGGGINGKLFFAGSGSLKAYGQLGIGVGINGAVGDDGGASAGASGVYGGLGLFAGSEKFYLYLSGNVGTNSNFFPQLGIGVGI